MTPLNKLTLPTLVVLSSLSLSAHSNSVYHPSGANLSLGQSSAGRTLMSSIANPSMPALSAKKGDSKFRFGILSSSGLAFEWGELDNIFDEIDQISDSLSDSLDSNNLANSSLAAQTTELIDDLNSLLVRLEADGYARGFSTIHAPIAPFIFNSKWLGGSVSVDYSISFGAQLVQVSDTVDFDATALQQFIVNNFGGSGSQTFGDVTINLNNDDISYSFASNESSLLLKAAQISQFSVGYSREMGQFHSGDVFAGVQANLYQVELYREIESISSDVDSEDVFEDFDSDNGKKTSAFDLDLGVLWVKDHYQVGATLNNLLEADFEYNPLSVAGLSETRIINAVQDSNTYTMDRQITLEGALYSESRSWVLSAVLDVNAVEDPFGNENQWLVLSGAFATPKWSIPGFRLGYRSNQAGTELDYLTGGLTLFKVVNLDLAYSLDSVEVDDDSYPRGFLVNLGFELPM